MAPTTSVIKEAPVPEPDPEPEPAPAPAGHGQLLRISAFQLMLFGATAIIGAAAAPVPWPRLFFVLLAWFVGCLSLFMARA
ncbi:hypothetical protein EJB05_20257, partial [Eragrostis curvula]